jgi:hypothetical protein
LLEPAADFPFYMFPDDQSQSNLSTEAFLLTLPIGGYLILALPRKSEAAARKELTTMWQRSLVSLVPMLFLLTAPAAEGQTSSGKIVSNGEIAGAIAGVAGAGAAIAIIVVHEHNVHTLKGCVSSDAGGLRMENAGDKRTHALTGDTAGIKSGERVKLSGKKMKGDKDHPQFEVSELAKDCGACILE